MPGLSGDNTTGRSPAMFALSAVTLGIALQVNYGQYHPVALLWLTVSLLSCVLGLIPRSSAALWDSWPQWLIVIAIVALQFLLFLMNRPGFMLKTSETRLIHLGGVVAAAVIAVALLGGVRWQRVCMPVFLGLYFAMGLRLIQVAPQPGIDVCLFQREGAEAMLRGKNPYSISFTNPYGDASLYAPGSVAGGRLLFGYPYPPLSLLFNVAGHVCGDFRYAQLFALTLSGALMAYARPGRLATAAAAIFLFTPMGLFVLQAGWTEPFVVLLLSLTIFVACRTKDATAAARFRRADAAPLATPGRHAGAGASALVICVGLLFAVKQYVVLGLPALWLLTPDRRSFAKLTLRGAVLAALISAPLALWDLAPFLKTVLVLQFHQPFRPDALSYLVPFARLTGSAPPAWVAFMFLPPAFALALWKSPRTPAGFAGAVALIFFTFFAFNKQAFCNYYLFVIGALCCAIAAAGPVIALDGRSSAGNLVPDSQDTELPHARADWQQRAGVR